MIKMNLHFTIWICFYGFCLQRYYATSSASVTPSDSTILNLVTENSTIENSDKLLKTANFNSRDSFSLNNVNTESLDFNSTNGECKNGHCTKNIYTSSNTDNSSSASKILWNFVSTAKSTTESHAIEEMDSSDETTEQLYFHVNANSTNDSAVNISSFSLNDNELDSEINSDNNSLEIHRTQMDQGTNNLFSSDNYYNFSAISKIPTVNTTEILLKELENSKENNTFGLEVTKIQPQTVFYNHNISDSLNVTEYITTPDTQEATIHTNDELDFTTYFLETSNSNDNANSLYFSQNYSTEMPYYDSEILSDNENSSTLIFRNYDIYGGSDEPKSKSSGSAINVNGSKLQTSSYSDDIVSVFNNSKNASNFPDYETSLEIEELKYKNSRMIDIVDIKNTSISPIPFDTSTNVWSGEEQPATLQTSLNIESVITERPTDRLEIRSTLTSETYDVFAENQQLNEESTTENIDSSHFKTTIKVTWKEMTNNDSLESTNSADITEPIKYVLNVTQTEAKTTIFTPIPNYSSMLFNSNDEPASKTSTKSTETVDLNSHRSEMTSIDHVISATQPSLNDSTTNDQNYSPDVSLSEVMSQNASLFESDLKSEFKDARTTLTESYDSAYINQNINVTDFNKSRSTFTPATNSNYMNDVDYNLASTETSYTISSDRSLLETSSMLPTVRNTFSTAILIEEENFSEKQTIKNQTSDISTENATESDDTINGETSVVNSTTTGSSEIASNNLRHISIVSANSTENYTKSGFTTTESFTKLTDITDNVAESHSHKIDSVAINEIFESTNTKPPYEDTTAERAVSHHSEIIKPIITENNFYENSHTEDKIVFPTTTRKTLIEVLFKSTSETVLKDFDTISSSSITTTTGDELPYTVTETHREGKHIPFSSTLARRTTTYPVIFNVTARAPSYPLQTDTTEHDLSNLRFSQIKVEELSPEERANVINAVVKFSDGNYSKDELMERMAVIHLWLLHAIADEYKNATFNLSVTNNTMSNVIEFENLPQISYVLPSPEVFLPNISVIFVVHNKWRNETFQADIILTILNLHAENLKKILVDIEEISFSQGLLMQKPDLISVIIEKYGIILLSTFLITVGMIFFLVCVVIYYRKKTRHSAHCLTDDKLHRNIQEAMGIDLNPAVIILQEEIREKAALNGNKISSLDGDEGWLAPIDDVPIEDNNAPFVQDTKL